MDSMTIMLILHVVIIILVIIVLVLGTFTHANSGILSTLLVELLALLKSTDPPAKTIPAESSPSAQDKTPPPPVSAVPRPDETQPPRPGQA